VYHVVLPLPETLTPMADEPKPNTALQPQPKTEPTEPPKELQATKPISGTAIPPAPERNDPLAPWVAWSAIIVVPLTLLGILIAIFPNESHDFAETLLHGKRPQKVQPSTPPNNAPSNQPDNQIPSGVEQAQHQPLPPEKLLRYTTFSISGELQQGYKFADDSTVVIDRDTGREVDAKITVIASDGSKEVFIATPWYQDDVGSMWQWQGQGSLKGSLDFQYKPHTFVDYVGGKPLSHSAYQRPNDPIVLSTNTILRPIATASTFP
jgi:hypothetical protein